MRKAVPLKSYLLFLSAVVISACSSTKLDNPIELRDQAYNSLYLRGVFTWWEADEAFKVEQITDTLFRANAKLIADGEPYDFKFADTNWTPGLSCGLSPSENVEFLQLDQPVQADCYLSDTQNFKFTPDESGLYSFFIDFEDYNSPKVYITY